MLRQWMLLHRLSQRGWLLPLRPCRRRRQSGRRSCWARCGCARRRWKLWRRHAALWARPPPSAEAPQVRAAGVGRRSPLPSGRSAPGCLLLPALLRCAVRCYTPHRREKAPFEQARASFGCASGTPGVQVCRGSAGPCKASARRQAAASVIHIAWDRVADIGGAGQTPNAVASAPPPCRRPPSCCRASGALLMSPQGFSTGRTGRRGSAGTPPPPPPPAAPTGHY